MRKKMSRRVMWSLSLPVLLLFSSCIVGIRGNGVIKSEDRQASPYSSVSVGQGISLVLVQGDTEKINVECDENLLPILKTEIRNDELKVYLDESIRSSKNMKVTATFRMLSRVHCSSGSEVSGQDTLKFNNINFDSSSGSDLDLLIRAEDVITEASSGSSIKLTGVCTSFNAQSSSGSDINAGKLRSQNSIAHASSGSEISLFASGSAKATTSSGASIHIFGDPVSCEKHSSSGGDVIIH